jgi:eukaryotic-like serine/threonine-protein kinase
VLCAGSQIFAQATANRPGSAPPIPTVENLAGPQRIGPYLIISDLGRGGMGHVYLAQHSQLGRIVALKVVPSGGSATSDLEMRFLREARTIARLNHPHIVAVHDAGRDRGHAYFSMDYYEDGDLARRLRARPFGPRDAGTLLRHVAEAIAFSHEAGVLHRDLKPSNILLAGESPHVADFGLAAELDSSGGLTARTVILGTPHYLAPEALSRGSAAQGVPSDIYALGVILHEMLTGRTPFAGASPAELPGLLARNDAPALRLLAPQVPPDLATICAKCLEFDPARRYATAAALAEDLGHFLAGEPIAARPISTGGQLLRWTRRRPALAATWLLSFSLAAASLAAALWINRERLRADEGARVNAALTEFLRRDVLEQAVPSGELDRDLKLRTALDRAAEKIPGRFADTPLAEADLRLTFGSTYYALGDYENAERYFRRAMLLRQRHLGVDHPETLRVAIELAAVLDNLGRTVEAAPLIRATAVTLKRTLGADHALSISAFETESLVEQALGHIAKAEALARQALASARRALGPDDELTRHALVNLATILYAQKKYDEDIALSREAVAVAERVFGPHHPTTLRTRVSLLTSLSDSGQAADTEPELRQLYAELKQQLGAEHPETLRTLNNLGGALSKLGRHAEAEAVFSEIVATRRRLLGSDHPSTIAAMKLLALAHGRNGHLDEAIALMREVVAASTRAVGRNHPTTLGDLRNVAAMLLSARRYDEALPAAEESYTALLREAGADNATTQSAAETYGLTLFFLRRNDDAEPVWHQLADTLTHSQPDNWHTHYVRGQWGKALALTKRYADAEPLLKESYAALIGQQPALPASRRDAPQLFAEQLAMVCTALARSDEAAEWRAKAVTP